MKKKDTTALAEAFRKLGSAAAEIADALDIDVDTLLKEEI